MENPPEGQAEASTQGTPFKKMNRRRKFVFILRLVVCIVTFGIVFPHVMSD